MPSVVLATAGDTQLTLTYAEVGAPRDSWKTFGIPGKHEVHSSPITRHGARRWLSVAFGRSLGGSTLIVARVNPSIFRARSRFQPGTKRWDLILVTLILFAMNRKRATITVIVQITSETPPSTSSGVCAPPVRPKNN